MIAQPLKSTTIRYVRRLRSGGFLVYHDARCRFAKLPGSEPVPAAEVQQALDHFYFAGESDGGLVRFRGKLTLPWPCRLCLPPRSDWPPV